MTHQLYYVAVKQFESARRVDILPRGHRAANVHGHSFLARIRAVVPEGWAPFPGAEGAKLAKRLADCIVPLDYTLLNDHVQIPTDENLARWVWERLDMPDIDSVGIQSTSEQGADLDKAEHAHIWRRFRFEAAHRLPNVPEGHKCGRMHGHGFEVILHVDQNVAHADMGIDFDDLHKFWKPLEAELNYRCLNDIPGLENPTSEILASWIWQRLKPQIPNLSWVTTYETHNAGCHYDGTHYRIWKEQRFESAVRLSRATPGDPRHRLHGHSYIVRLHVSAPLDDVMGWTIDYGDVKEIFHAVYEQLDHHNLNELAGIRDTDVANVLHWVREHMIDRLPQLDRLDLYESPGCGAVLCWGEQRPALPV